MSIRILATGEWPPGVPAEALAPRPPVARLLRDVRAVCASIDTVAVERSDALPRGALESFFDAGLFTLTAPPEHGGMGARAAEFAQVIETLAECDASLAVTAVPHLGNGIKSIALFGNDDQKAEVFGNLSAERRLISFAITEASTGSDVASHRAKLTADGSGGLRLQGGKTWITNIPLARHVVVVAKCPGLARIPDASAFVLVKPGDTGFSATKSWEKAGVNAAATVDLFFDDVPLSADRVVGEMGQGMPQFTRVVGSGRLGAAAAACGLAKRALRFMTESCGRDPLAQRTVARARQRLHLMHAVLLRTAWEIDRGAPDHDITTALGKTFCTTSAEEIIRGAHAMAVDHWETVPAGVMQLTRELPIFKVLEGPNELLDYRAALGLLTSLRGAAAPAENQISPLLEWYRDALRRAAATPRLMEQETMLADVAEMSMHVYVAACALQHRGPSDDAPWTDADAAAARAGWMARIRTRAGQRAEGSRAVTPTKGQGHHGLTRIH